MEKLDNKLKGEEKQMTLSDQTAVNVQEKSSMIWGRFN